MTLRSDTCRHEKTQKGASGARCGKENGAGWNFGSSLFMKPTFSIMLYTLAIQIALLGLFLESGGRVAVK